MKRPPQAYEFEPLVSILHWSVLEIVKSLGEGTYVAGVGP